VTTVGAGTVGLPPTFFEPLLDLVVERLVPPLTAELATALHQVDTANETWRLLDVDEVAIRLGRSARWVRERAKQGQLPFVRLDGGALAFELEDVHAFARARRVSAGKPPPLAGRLHDVRNRALPESSAQGERATNPEVET
jgi:excisionase family DNA binding protein